MKKITTLALALLLTTMCVQAKTWKVGPASVPGMDFGSINAAMSGISAGDTLFLDQYYNESAEQNVTKRVVIIGTGYDTSLTDEQVVATLTGTLNLKANNIVVKSTKLANANFYNEGCTIERCYATSICTKSSTAGMNNIYSCYVNGYVQGYSDSNRSMLDLQNNVIISTSSDYSRYLTASIINNNTIVQQSNQYCIAAVDNSNITNNIILAKNTGNDMGASIYASGSGNTIEHNVLSHGSALTYYPNNKTGFDIGSLFLQEGEYSNYYRLVESNVIQTYATDGGEVGCHGGMFGCPSGGRPQYIPYFTKVVVGSRSENGKLPVSVSVKIQNE